MLGHVAAGIHKQQKSPSTQHSALSSVFSDHPNDDALNEDIILVDVHRVHRLVRGLQADTAIALPIEALHCRRVAVQQGNHCLLYTSDAADEL